MEKISKFKIDAIDRALIELLQKDSTQSVKQLAAHLNLTATPIYERIKKIERNGIIEKYTAVINPKKIGKDLLVFTNVSLKEHSKDYLLNFEQKILQIDEVIECHHVSGEHDYLLKVLVKNMDDYRAFLTHKLAKIANIGNVHSSFVVGEVKKDSIIKI
jgi:Lrp/AsnC family leucine-responsive transcriptional regulator